MMKMTTTLMINQQTTWTACAFRTFVLAFAVISFSASAFEYQDFEKKIKNGYTLRSAVDKMPRLAVEMSLRDFVSNSRPSRIVGSPGHKKAQDYLEKKLLSYSNLNAKFS